MKTTALLTLNILFIVLASCQQHQNKPSDSSDNLTSKETKPMQERLDLKAPGNAELLFKKMEKEESFQPLLDLCSDSVTFKATIRPGTPISGTFRGKKEVTEYFNDVLPQVASFKQLQPLEFFINDNAVVVLGDDEYTIEKNGTKHHSPYVMVLKVDDAQITEILIIQDLSVLWEAYQDAKE